VSDADLGAPIFVVGSPPSGDAQLVPALARASGVWHARTQAASFLDALPEIEAAARDRGSHRLTADDAADLGEAARSALRESLVDREGHGLDHAGGSVLSVAGGARLALRIPFLAAAFEGARFVFVARAPEEALTEMLTAWRSGHSVSVPDLDGWHGPPWSLPLIPGWRHLAGEPLDSIVVEQWRAVTETALDDLNALGGESWLVADYGALLADPRNELRRLCDALGIRYDQALISPLEDAARVRAAAPETLEPGLQQALPRAEAAVARVRAFLAAPGAPAQHGAAAESPLRSVFTDSFARGIEQLGSSLLISTYQTGKLICARARNGSLNTHFRNFEKPMGLAVGAGRFFLGTRTEVWDFRDMPQVAPKIEPPGSHDACYLPRNRHVTGDISIHELTAAQGHLWFVATAFSCLATLDADHSFVPRWKPPFVSELAPGDRCHLNGLCAVDGHVRYVTALGTTDEPGGWRERKASGGVIVDVPSSEIVVTGLSMPHSPRWHDGRLWVLESGKGELCVVDLDSGRSETVVELPGFTRGLAFTGRTAFVGLSQIRESSTFGDLPLVERLEERLCGVWAVDIVDGAVVGFLRFDDLVQEVFDVALLPGKRWPEIAEPGSSAVATSFELP
jgi:uncharacterized protein (TIGR03032 family)